MAMTWNRILCILGTLSHNRGFKPREIAEYLRFEPGVHAINPAKIVRRLKKHGLIRKGDARGEYYPTPKGWKTIERSCKR
jgi:DNA-binding IclR family transcriptional regulator